MLKDLQKILDDASLLESPTLRSNHVKEKVLDLIFISGSKDLKNFKNCDSSVRDEMLADGLEIQDFYIRLKLIVRSLKLKVFN